MASNIPVVKLSSKISCPILGLGTWKSKPGEVCQAVKDAIDIGYRHFDCAHVYQNEKEVGEAIRAKIKEGVISREDLFITSKLWNTYHKKELVVPACKKTLSDLGLDYLDLYLIHWPFGFKEGDDLFPADSEGKTEYSDVDYRDTWRGMESCHALQLTRAIGLSNFNHEQIKDILDIAKIKPLNNQVECHPYLTQKKLIDWCKNEGITVTAYSPLGSPDRPWAKATEPQLMDNPQLLELAAKYSKSPAQILIRYQIERGVIVIPKSVTKSRIQANFEVFDFSLKPEDIAALDALHCQKRLCGDRWNKDHKYYSFDLEF